MKENFYVTDFNDPILQAFLDNRISIKEAVTLQTDFEEGIITQLFTTVKTIEKNLDKCVFMFISACVGKDRVFKVMGKERPDNEKLADKMWKEYNKRSTEELKVQIKGSIGRKWKFISCKGGYIEKTGEEVTEKSFMIWGPSDTKDDLFRLGTEWCKRFVQESFLIISEGGTKNDYYDSTGKRVLGFKSITFDQKFVSDYFTKIHGKKFVLYDIEEEYRGYNNALEGMCWYRIVIDPEKINDEVYMKNNNEQFEKHRKWLFNQIEEEFIHV